MIGLPPVKLNAEPDRSAIACLGCFLEDDLFRCRFSTIFSSWVYASLAMSRIFKQQNVKMRKTSNKKIMTIMSTLIYVLERARDAMFSSKAGMAEGLTNFY